MSAATVLVVDDEPVVLDVLRRMLKREGYQVFSASRPRKALEIVNEQTPIDLIVSDICMPEMQGTELIREVARIGPQTARMLMTGGVVGPADLPDTVLILRKPVSTADLLSAVRASLARSVSLRAKLSEHLGKAVELQQQGEQLMFQCQAAGRQATEAVKQSRHARESRRQAIELDAQPWFGETTRSQLEAPPASVLTTREIEVLKLIGDGLTSKQIGRQLGISVSVS